MKKLTTILISIFTAVTLSAFNRPVTPVDSLPAYYESIDGTSGKTLVDAIQLVAKLGYRTDDFRYDSIWLAFQHTDLRPDGYIWEIYSDCDFVYEKDRTSNTTQTGECKGYNREHAMCQSWFGTASLAGKEMSSSKKNSPGSDIFHIYPTAYGMNSRRGNRPYGEVAVAAYTSFNGTKYGTPKSISVSNTVAGAFVEASTSMSTNVLEPVDEYKGDIARSYFGTMVKWAGEWAFNKAEEGRVIFDATIDADTHYGPENNYGLTPYGVAMLLKWHRQDPVSKKEIDRNNAIQLTQGNRNPFIDYPYLAEYIWGEMAGQTLDFDMLLCSADERFLLDHSNGYLGQSTSMPIDTVFWMLGDEVMDYSYIYHGSQLKYLPQEPTSCAANSKHFMGWTPKPIHGTSNQAPARLYKKVTDFPAIQSNIRYYAVFAEKQSNGQKGQTISLNKTDSTSWILSDLKQTRNSTDGDYWLLVKNASITSPKVDLSSLDSIVFTIRSYQSKKNISILVDGVNIGQLSATTNTMQRYVWFAPELAGTRNLFFTSPDATASYGPGISEISLYIGSQQDTYTNYLTHCNLDTGLAIITTSEYTKILRNGQLLILIDGDTYNIQGVKQNY
jgi:endonuclease I